MQHCTLIITPSAPFNFDATLHKPDHFPTADNLWQPGVRWQTMRWQGKPLGLKFENLGGVDDPRLALHIFSEEALDNTFLEGLATEIEYRYAFQLDLNGFYSRFTDDPVLYPVIQRWRGMRPLNCNTLYEYLIIAIALQNATVRRSVQMMQALFEHYGTLLHYDGQDLYCFWQPKDLAQVNEEELRALKVGYRAKSIRRVTDAFIRGEIDEFYLRGRPIGEQRQALLSLYGIGPASVGYVLSDVFHQTDEMEHISPWEQKIYSRLFFDLDPETPAPAKELIDYFNQHFGGFRNLAVHYFWEDLFWKRKNEPVEWLEKLIRL